MKLPQVLTISNLTSDLTTSITTSCKDGSWIPSRPEPYSRNPMRNLINRIKLAWGVFNGTYDAVDWEEYRHGSYEEKLPPVAEPSYTENDIKEQQNIFSMLKDAMQSLVDEGVERSFSLAVTPWDGSVDLVDINVVYKIDVSPQYDCTFEDVYADANKESMGIVKQNILEQIVKIACDIVKAEPKPFTAAVGRKGIQIGDFCIGVVRTAKAEVLEEKIKVNKETVKSTLRSIKDTIVRGNSYVRVNICNYSDVVDSILEVFISDDAVPQKSRFIEQGDLAYNFEVASNDFIDADLVDYIIDLFSDMGEPVFYYNGNNGIIKMGECHITVSPVTFARSSYIEPKTLLSEKH